MSGIKLKTPSELARMRQAGRLVGEVLRLMKEMAQPGVRTDELDRAAEEHIESSGGRPAFKGYRGYPATICASIGEEIVHGIPGPRRVQEGELLKVDVGAVWEGFYGDAAVTIAVGEVSEAARRLMEATRRALRAAIAAVSPGVQLHEVSRAVQETAEQYGFSVVRDYHGHGIGRALHEEPTVPNYVSRRTTRNSPTLEPGMVLAIEPMLNVGTHRTEALSDGWTVVTKDRELSAHFEHTVAVEEGGPSILTLP